MPMSSDTPAEAEKPAEVTVCADDSATFARLSGDYNPLHLDPVAARRTPFGGTVVHGMHLLLAALDATAGSWSRDGLEPVGIRVTFSNPVRTGETFRIVSKAGDDPEALRLIGEAGGRTAFTARIQLGRPRSHEAMDLGPEGAECETATPRDLDFPPTTSGGEVPLRAARDLLCALFPALARLRRLSWIADLLATTRVVGMECPGANSIYCGCKLLRIDSRDEPAARSLQYRIDSWDERFRSVRLAVEGCALAGSLDVLFRPAPVAQLPLREIVRRIATDSFRGQRALVVGGSRGLGELTAKLILAGGGDVTLTYSRGRDDAERIRAEAQALGRTCAIEHLDVLADSLPGWVAAPFSHVYFFASPQIPKNVTGRWDHALFRRLEAVYVRAFAAVAEAILAASHRAAPPVFVYPSSVFLTTHEKGFAEYCVAKAAGEALCDHLARQYGALFARPRLPRMRTDQTSGVADTEVEDSMTVLDQLLRGLPAAIRLPPSGAP